MWSALGLIVVVGAALLLLPNRRGDGRIRPVSVVLAIQSAGAWLAVAIGTGVAIRGRQLVDVDAESLPEILVRLPAPDGDTRFYGLLIASVVVLVGLPAVLLTLATYLSSSADPLDLRLVRATLAGEIALGVLAGAAFAVDNSSRVWPGTVLVLNAVASAGALAALWLRSAGESVDRVDDGRGIDLAPAAAVEISSVVAGSAAPRAAGVDSHDPQGHDGAKDVGGSLPDAGHAHEHRG